MFHAKDEAYFKQIWFWATPQSDCLDGRTDTKCVPYSEWTKAWSTLPAADPAAVRRAAAAAGHRPAAPEDRGHRPGHRRPQHRLRRRRRRGGGGSRRACSGSRRARLAGLLAPAGAVAGAHLLRRALLAAVDGVLQRRRVHQRGRAHLHDAELRQDVFTDPAYLQADAADRRDRGVGHRPVHRASACRWRSSWRRSRGRGRAGFLVALVDHAAVGVLPRQGLRLAGDGAAGDRRDRLAAQAVRALRPRLRRGRHHPHADLPVAAVHDPADLRRARAAARLAARRVRRPRRPALADLPQRGRCR